MPWYMQLDRSELGFTWAWKHLCPLPACLSWFSLPHRKSPHPMGRSGGILRRGEGSPSAQCTLHEWRVVLLWAAFLFWHHSIWSLCVAGVLHPVLPKQIGWVPRYAIQDDQGPWQCPWRTKTVFFNCGWSHSPPCCCWESRQVSWSQLKSHLLYHRRVGQ